MKNYFKIRNNNEIFFQNLFTKNKQILELK